MNGKAKNAANQDEQIELPQKAINRGKALPGFAICLQIGLHAFHARQNLSALRSKILGSLTPSLRAAAGGEKLFIGLFLGCSLSLALVLSILSSGPMADSNSVHNLSRPGTAVDPRTSVDEAPFKSSVAPAGPDRSASLEESNYRQSPPGVYQNSFWDSNVTPLRKVYFKIIIGNVLMCVFFCLVGRGLEEADWS
jgi:hypothetical protein